MIVTDIIPQKKDPSKQNIYIDHVFAFALIAQDVRYFKLRVGEEVAQETYDFIQENLIYIKAQDTALRYLGYRMRTEAEIRKKLAEQAFSEETIEQVLVFLRKYGYCDDQVYARSFIRERLRLQPKGAYALKMELRQKGVPEQVIAEVLAETQIDEVADAVAWIVRKTRGRCPTEEKEKKRLYAFLQRKGYHWDVIAEAFRLAEGREV
ncbi:MAG TPA: recombination regulator RecX [Candidatus Anaerotignum merdipullorum]|nr:recombination regulator RecX [Candidatus Anaerotignum merdipullorum]